MADGHLLDTYWPVLGAPPVPLDASRLASDDLAHLGVMNTDPSPGEPVEAVLTLSELAAQLAVSVQTLYDLRSKGRGPRGFRIGRELRFRRSEVDAWLVRLEAADAARHPAAGR